MENKTIKRIAIATLTLAAFLGFSTSSRAATVRLYFDSAAPQIAFAAGDIKAALEKRKFTVETHALSALKADDAGKKIILSVASDKTVVAMLSSQGGKSVGSLGAQAYALRTTNKPELSYWVLGGDANGAMYGGLEIAENINFHGFGGSYDSQESPSILKRGIKLNYPLDANSPTYGKLDNGTFDGVSYKHAISNIWDMSYWTEWFDEMARNRYNVISLWLCHPFPALVEMDEYPDVALKNVAGFDGYTKTMTMDQKIDFWRKVMAYAHARGFEFYFFNWNLFTYGATGKYGITSKINNPATVNYMYKSMKKLLETYPDLDGFGITAGEKMTGDVAANEKFLWETYGKAVYDHALKNPNRKFSFIHRYHFTKLSDLKGFFRPLFTLPNVEFSMSYKYSQAHMFSCTTPKWWDSDDVAELTSNNMKTWFTVRNDDFYYHNWGDPDYLRAYVNSMPGKTNYMRGFYMGSDGFCPTRTFFSKDSVSQGVLEVKRQWYLFKLMGRLSYNPKTSDDVFKNYMALKYSEISSTTLFEAWKKSSRGIPKMLELVAGKLRWDMHLWPEGCQSSRSSTSFVTIDSFISSRVSPGSKLCGFANTVANKCDGEKSTYVVADEMESDALAALKLVDPVTINPNMEFGVAINNIKAMSYLTIYYAYKIRAATDKMASKPSEVSKSLAKAYCWWLKYSKLMDQMYDGMTMQRVDDFPNWHHQDASVLKEYHDNGGVGMPSCEEKVSK